VTTRVAAAASIATTPGSGTTATGAEAKMTYEPVSYRPVLRKSAASRISTTPS